MQAGAGDNPTTVAAFAKADCSGNVYVFETFSYCRLGLHIATMMLPVGSNQGRHGGRSAGVADCDGCW